MKLIGSLTEKKFRAELTASQRGLLELHKFPRLLTCLQNHFAHISSALILGWTPEQLEDLYDVLINGTQVASLEIAKNGDEIEFSVASAEDYAGKLKGRPNKIQFAVALDLARSGSSVGTIIENRVQAIH